MTVIWNFAPHAGVQLCAMEKLARTQLLPGVEPAGLPPRVVFRSEAVIKHARFRAAIRDSADLLLLLVVDALFIRWPLAHVPLLDRRDSVAVLLALNVLLIAYVWLSRRVPQWRARRVSSTWCGIERARFRR